MRRRVDEVLAVVDDVGEVLERGPPRLRVRQRARRGPAVRRRQRAGRAGGRGTAGGRGAAAGRAGADLYQLPLLVGAAPVGVLHHRAAVSGRGSLYLQGLPAGVVDEPHVPAGRVRQLPLLVGAVEVGPLLDRSTVGGGEVVVVEDLAGVPGLDPVVAATGVDELELLVRPARGRVLLHARTIGGGRAADVEHLAAVAVDDGVPGSGVHRRGRRRGGRHRDDATADHGSGRGQRDTQPPSPLHAAGRFAQIHRVPFLCPGPLMPRARRDWGGLGAAELPSVAGPDDRRSRGQRPGRAVAALRRAVCGGLGRCASGWCDGAAGCGGQPQAGSDDGGPLGVGPIVTESAIRIVGTEGNGLRPATTWFNVNVNNYAHSKLSMLARKSFCVETYSEHWMQSIVQPWEDRLLLRHEEWSTRVDKHRGQAKHQTEYPLPEPVAASGQRRCSKRLTSRCLD